MISVVIVTYNSKDCIGGCVESARRNLPTAEILVVDNASTDDSPALARRFGATVAELPANLGFGRACNAGAERAQHEHVLFLNPDVVLHSVDAGELEALIANETFGLVVPAAGDTSFLFHERSWIAESLSLPLRALRPRELPRRAYPPRPGGAPWVSAAALLVRTSEFLEAGGFDPRFFLYYEDRDLSWRYRERGLPLQTTTALRADHAGGGSSTTTDRRAHIAAFAILGWLQYQHEVRGRRAAQRSWRLLRGTHALITGLVGRAAQLLPSPRVRRKSLQLREIDDELTTICASSGVLQQSDAHAYWPSALTVVHRMTPNKAMTQQRAHTQ